MIQTIFSSQTGAPVLSGTAGSLISVLDACLVTGFNTVTVASATFSAGTVTLNISAGHHFVVDQYITVSGANEADYNGTFKVTAATTTTVQYAITGTPTSPATGTITAKVAPLGWTKPFSDAGNHAAYRPAAGNRLYLRIDDNGPVTTGSYGLSYRTAEAYMLEDMTDINTWTPATGYAKCYIRKAQNLTTTARPWILIGDEKRFYLFINWSETYPDVYSPYFFGDIVSFKSGDVWNTLLIGHYGLSSDSYNPNNYNVGAGLYNLSNTSINKGILLVKSSLQSGGYISGLLVNGCQYRTDTYWQFGTDKIAYPNSADNGLFFQPVFVQEQTNLPNIRGSMPGLWAPFQLPIVSAGYGQFICSIGGVSRTILVVRCGVPYDGNNSNITPYSNPSIDLTGPWE